MIPKFSNFSRMFMLFGLITGIGVTTLAQNKTQIDQKQKSTKPSTCEYIKNALDYSLIDAKKSDGSFLIILFRLGKSEKSSFLIKSRKMFVKKYLDFRDPLFKSVVLATAPPVSELGKLEIYVNGKLSWEIFLKIGKGGWDSCIE